MPGELVGTRAGTTSIRRAKTPKDVVLADGWKTRLPEEDLLAVVKSLDLITRNRLGHLAKALGLDEVSTLVWLNEKTASTYPKAPKTADPEARILQRDPVESDQIKGTGLSVWSLKNLNKT